MRSSVTSVDHKRNMDARSKLNEHVLPVEMKNTNN
jgi:hypothetical protein